MTILLAEVSDKLPSIPMLWILGLILAAVTCGACMASRWWFVPSILVAIFILWTSWADLAPGHWHGAAVIREIGHDYRWQAFAAGLLPLIGIGIALAWHIARGSRQPQQAPWLPRGGEIR